MRIGSEAALGGGAGYDGTLYLPPVRSPWAAVIQWLHMCSLFTLLSVVGVGAMVLDGVGLGTSLARLPAVLYWWIPPILGIVVAATPVRDLNARRIWLLVILGVVLLIVFDSLGAATHAQLPLGPAVMNDGRAAQAAGPVFSAESSLKTLWAWASGDLPNATQQLVDYPARHDRTFAVMALSDSSALFIALGTVGLLAALRRWIDENVVFRTSSNDLVIGAILGWIISPSLMIMITSMIGTYAGHAMFRGAPLLLLWVPGAVLAAFGTLGIFYAVRRPR